MGFKKGAAVLRPVGAQEKITANFFPRPMAYVFGIILLPLILKIMVMERQEEKQPAAKPAVEETSTAKNKSSEKDDNTEESYPGRLDSVEGRMNNGELGGNLNNTEEQKR
jgi:hypothetical protein